MKRLPKIIPVNELKNTSNIMKMCHESEVPIVITKNGYGEAVMMSVELFEKLFEQVYVAGLINEGLKEAENGEYSDGKEFLESLLHKYDD